MKRPGRYVWVDVWPQHQHEPVRELHRLKGASPGINGAVFIESDGSVRKRRRPGNNAQPMCYMRGLVVSKPMAYDEALPPRPASQQTDEWEYAE